MATTSYIKNGINTLLRPIGLKVGTLKAESAERARLEGVAAGGHFDGPVFPVPSGFHHIDCGEILARVAEAGERLDRNEVGFTWDNAYYGSPDAEVLYAAVRAYEPDRIVEVGCGNSTRISRQAIRDGGLRTVLTAVDPDPRIDVANCADTVLRMPIERAAADGRIELAAGDFLFIDSSHVVSPGNDCVALFNRILPSAAPGVIVHIHDVFLPYEYPRRWIVDEGWAFNEQNLVHAMLMFGDAFDVLWAGHFLQRTRPDFARLFPRAGGRSAQSLWLRKTC